MNIAQSSATILDAPSTPARIHLPVGEIDHEFVRKFRKQIHSLGVVWVGLAVLGAAAVIALPSLSNATFELSPMTVIVLGLCAAQVALGVLSCLKRMWAVKAGLVLSYVSLVGQLAGFVESAGRSPSLAFPMLPLVIVGTIILQAHRVLRWAKQMEEAGIPLTFRP